MYNIIPTPRFLQDVEYYQKKKKYKKITNDIDTITDQLEKGHLLGDVIDGIGLVDGEDIYKVRAINTDTKQGKSNGYRIIYYVIKNDSDIYLLTIYSKKDDDRVIDKNEIKNIIREYCK